MINLRIQGLRDALGRFHDMRDHRMQEIQLQASQDLALQLEALYQGLAPVGETGEFRDSITGYAARTHEGFAVSVDTSEPDLARWLREGTGIYGPVGERIIPVASTVLSFFWLGQQWFLASVAGMEANPWEGEADLQAKQLGVSGGNKIGVRVITELGGT